MRAGLEQPDGVLILTGEEGMGKTTLITHLLGQQNKDTIVAFVRNPQQKVGDFLLEILAALDLPITEQQPKELFNVLHRFVLEHAKSNKKVLLAIDNAETMSQNCIELIRLLSSLRLNEKGLLQVVLVGNSELDAKLSSAQNEAFRQQVLMSCSLQPLQLLDMPDYIIHRLKVVGWAGDPAFDDDAYVALHQLTGGIPKIINQYCDQLLKYGMSRQIHRFNRRDIEKLRSTAVDQTETREPELSSQDEFRKKLDSVFDDAIPLRPELGKAASVRHSDGEKDNEKFNFGTPAKGIGHLFGKQTMTLAGVAALVAALSFFAFEKMSEKPVDSGMTSSIAHGEATSIVSHEATQSVSHGAPTHNVSHSNTASHSSTDSGADGHSSGSEPIYTLDEIPAEARSREGGSHLLDIRQLLENLHDSNSGIKPRLSNDVASEGGGEYSDSQAPELASNHD